MPSPIDPEPGPGDWAPQLALRVEWLQRRIKESRRAWLKCCRNPRLTGRQRAFDDLAHYTRRLCLEIWPRPADKIRAYTDKGEKVFLPFDIHAFNAVMIGTARQEQEFGNATLERALSAATGNVDEGGTEHTYLKLEWMCRDPETGKPTLSESRHAQNNQ